MQQQRSSASIPDSEAFWTAEQRRQFRRKLLAWFDKHHRQLPWRETRDAYCVWISEIMLQQTQVSTVVPYFEKFLERFPNVYALAEADEETVLRYWEGLGYYRRARQMHQAAQRVVTEHQGVLPTQSDALQTLPGIGRYTAGAILSIAHDLREPILEANTIRLLARLIALQEPTTTAASQAALWRVAGEVLPRKRVGLFNQALMELGSLVCTPRAPACSSCPVARHCSTFAQGLQEEIPVPKQKTQYEAVEEAALVIWSNDQLLLRRCGSDERWAGLWDFPRFAVQATSTTSRRREVARRAHEMTGVPSADVRKLTVLKHAVTRYRITLTCYEALATETPVLVNNEDLQWLAVEQLEATPLSVTGRKLADLLTSRNQHAER